jgi:hypothetical protein
LLKDGGITLATGVAVDAILDQDDLVGDSATALATQQSIKAYVDAQVGTVDTLAEVLANGNTTGGTNISFGDNDKAIFGAGSDLQIYHDGGNTFINEGGTGSLYIQARDLYLRDYDTSVSFINMLNNGAVTLHHAGNAKLSTTSTGIDVTGTVTADGLTVDGAALVRSGNTLTLNRTDNAVGGAMSYVAGTGFIFNDVNGDGTSFNEGATNKFRIDSSGRVGIGTSSPSSYDFNDPAKLVVANTSGNSTLTIASGASNIGYLAFADGTTGTSRYSGSVQYNHSTNALSMHTTDGTPRLTIASTGAATFSGSVTLAGSSAGLSLSDSTTADNTIQLITTGGYTYVGANGSAGNRFIGSSAYASTFGTTAANALELATANTVRMTISSTGAATFGGTLSSGGITTTGNTSAGAASAGDGRLFPNNSYGAFVYGNGTVYDVALGQRSTGVALGVLAGTTNVVLSGTLNGISTTKSASGNRWGILPEVESNGVMEIGRYIDFHSTDGDTSDYGARLDYDGTNIVSTNAFSMASGIYLGGTGAANLLDDYESGAFVPTVTNGDGNMSGISYITQAGYYQKIGDLVWFRMQVGFSATTIGTGNFTVTGLPYASINEASARQQATVLTYNLDWDPIWKQIHTEGVQNTNSIVFLISRDNAVWAGLQAEDMADGITYYYIISGCYVTN